MSIRQISLAVLVTMTSCMLLGCGYQNANFKRTDTIEHVHVASAPLRVDVANGSIEVKATDGEAVVIEATLKARTQERLDNTSVAVTRGADQTLDIRVQWPEGKRLSNEGCSITIAIPDATVVDLHSSNGRLTVTGVGSTVKLHSSNGNLTVSGVPGAIDAKTSNGNISFTDIGGAITVDTSNGKIGLTEVRGPIKADTSNGSIDIRLTDDATGPIIVDSSNGSATLAVGAGFSGNLRLSTSNGKVTVFEGVTAESTDVAKTSRTLVFTGSGDSKLSTSNGSITVKTTAD
jgi:DUF4097 and DUF4098 domain-containing protein YvlB